MAEQAMVEERDGGLKSECLSFPEVLGQSVANVAPTASPTVNIPLVFASAASGTWLAYLVATVGMLLVGANINHFARRSASPGSLYGYVERGLGPVVGLLAGWALVGAYVLTAMASLCAFADYGQVILKALGVHATPVALFAGCAAVIGYLAYRDVKLSTVLMLLLEFLSIAMILAVAAIVLLRQGFQPDMGQIRLEGVSPDKLRMGLVLAVFSFVGFESATSLGDEAKDPLRSIPRSVMGSTLMAGLFFIVMSYVEVAGFRGLDPPLDKSEAPLNTLAELAGVGYFGILISISALVSFFACGLASVNAGARVAYALGQQGILHPLVGQAHPTNSTPAVAVVMSTLAAFLVTAAMSMFGVGVLDIYGYVGTLATFGFLLVYVLISISAPLYLKREGVLRPLDAGLSVLTVLFMFLVVQGFVYPVPEPPFNVFPYLFLGTLALGGGWLLMLHLHSPKTLQRVSRAGDEAERRFQEG